VAAHKYVKLGGEYAAGGMREPTEEVMERAQACFAAQGVETSLGG